METLEWIRFIVGTIFLLSGLFTFFMEIISIYKLKYVLDRMHAAATGDTLGILLSVIGLMIMNGLNFTTCKMALIIIFFWCASPASSHLIARLEVTTNESEDKYGRVEK